MGLTGHVLPYRLQDREVDRSVSAMRHRQLGMQRLLSGKGASLVDDANYGREQPPR